MSQVAIQFHQHFTYYFLNLFFYVSRKSCRNATLYEKFVRLTLMKLTPDQHQPQEILNPFSRRQSSYTIPPQKIKLFLACGAKEKGAELVCFFLTIILKLFVAFLDEPSFGQFLLPAQPNYVPIL